MGGVLRRYLHDIKVVAATVRNMLLDKVEKSRMVGTEVAVVAAAATPTR
jgi:hypothetical protein